MADIEGRLWRDNFQRYGLISRGLHWLMTGVLTWQFAGAVLFVSIGDTALTRFVGGRHLEVGSVLFLLVILRAGWALTNRGHRPLGHGRLGGVARWTHLLLYGLMLLVPGLGLLRQFGSGQPFSVFGVRVFSARPDKIEWMMIPGDLLHYWLGFFLLALAIGHASAAIFHKVLWKDGVLDRMT